ncbi:MAG: site-2 protease family protein [Verrucomicrobia bacterium]|nr:site-2 protease family protein [Verrucomicrobiota bacterium]
MDQKALFDGLVMYLCFIPILTFHEWAHAWVAWKCGDDTARLQGRVSLNPIVHIDPIGTIALPLLAVFLGASGSGLGRFIIGWGKPVPVNLYNLRHPRRDDTLVALAGPAMNVVLAFVVLGLGKLGALAGSRIAVEMSVQLAQISLFLCFFNLLPIPPLDGSHVVKNFIGMKDETYWRLCQFGFIAVILVIQIEFVRQALVLATLGTLVLMGLTVGLRL